MENIAPQLYTLLVFMVIGSIVAVETKNLLSAVISVSAVGFALSVAFLFMGAPDIAITQLVVEILVLIILIRGTIPLMRVSRVYVQTGLPATYAANIVTSVILDFRAYDTLGEATVLFASVLGALALLRKDGKVKRREVAAA